MSNPKRRADEPAPPGTGTSAQVALFDFDRTLTTRDTFVDFCIRTGGRTRCLRALPALFLALLEREEVARNTALKRALVRTLFGGWTGERIREAGRVYAGTRLAGLLRAEALARVRWHQEQGHRVIVVSASLDAWIAPWCRAMQLELIATGLALEDGKVTGEFDPPNCHGPEKARRVIELIGKTTPRPTIHAYGDSEGDRQMLELADIAYYRSFDRPNPVPRGPAGAPGPGGKS